MSISETVCQTADPSTYTDCCCSTMSQNSAPSWTPKRSHLTPTPSTGFVFLPLTCWGLVIQTVIIKYMSPCLNESSSFLKYSLHSWAVCFPATAFLMLRRPCGTPTSSRLTPFSSSPSCSSSSSMPSMLPLVETIQKHHHSREMYDLICLYLIYPQRDHPCTRRRQQGGHH